MTLPYTAVKLTDSLGIVLKRQRVSRFKAQTVKEMIHSVLNDELGGKIYNAEEAEVWTKTITSAVRNKIKGLQGRRHWASVVVEDRESQTLGPSGQRKLAQCVAVHYSLGL
uniref:Uncharacterized protein n=2 Tax=Timema TaxID=61471 RepID=A0A7R9DDG4_TIMPO|nr:unnamed protein product [Timema douglasi]CAD7412688.1 unnamed protein product [Timema poppensis]